jgi:hypothetical protein
MGQSWSRPSSAVAFHHVVSKPVTTEGNYPIVVEQVAGRSVVGRSGEPHGDHHAAGARVADLDVGVGRFLGVLDGDGMSSVFDGGYAIAKGRDGGLR